MSTSRSGAPRGDDGVPVGVALARLRRRAGLTGQQLGQRAGMSQAKISKIETGAISPSGEDVERLARELDLPPAEVNRLARQAERRRAEHHRAEQQRDRIAALDRNDPGSWQREVARLEAEATELRSFQPAALPGLLQTSEYARAVLTTVQAAWTEAAPAQPTGVAEAVSARVRRQEILEDPDKRFHFVVPETALHNLVTEPEDLPAQLHRLRQVAEQDNVTLSMIPENVRWPYPPLHGFLLLDDRSVVIDLANTVIVLRDQPDIQLYRKVFDALESSAALDIAPILDKHRQRYLRLAAER